jgi:hypothetical protein
MWALFGLISLVPVTLREEHIGLKTQSKRQKCGQRVEKGVLRFKKSTIK